MSFKFLLIIKDLRLSVKEKENFFLVLQKEVLFGFYNNDLYMVRMKNCTRNVLTDSVVETVCVACQFLVYMFLQ